MSQNLFAHILRRPRPTMRLFCFPYAGANAAYYRPWGELLPDDIELWPIELPGRGVRFGEPLQAEMQILAHDIAGAIAGKADIPFALFGHSMGSAIAFATALGLLDHGLKPEAVIASGRAAPHRVRKRGIHRLADDGILAEIRRLGGTPDEILANAELMDLVLPVVRNDYRLIETYHPDGGAGIESPIHVFCGRDDLDAAAGDLEAWSELTQQHCDLAYFDGDHFYLNERRHEVVATVVARLRALIDGRSFKGSVAKISLDQGSPTFSTDGR